MTCRQLNQSIALRQKEDFATYHECARSLADKRPEGRVDFARTTRVQDQHLCAEDTCRVLYDPSFGRGLDEVGWVDEHRYRSGRRHQRAHQLKTFCNQIHIEDCNCEIETPSMSLQGPPPTRATVLARNDGQS
jgi:hypothetical protein